MFDNLTDKLDKAFHILKGHGKITDVNVADTLKATVISNNTLLWYGNNQTGGSSSTSSIKPMTNNVGVVFIHTLHNWGLPLFENSVSRKT